MPTNFENTGGAAATTLSGALSAVATAITVADGTGYPTGAGGKKFVIAIGDPDSASYEKILCDSRSGNSITANASGRGYDGTTATTHSNGDAVNHVWTAVAANDTNTHVNDVTGADHTGLLAKSLVDVKGDLLVATAADTIDRLPVGAVGQTLVPDIGEATGVKWAYTVSAVGADYVAAQESTTSTSYTDLVTSGPAVTLTVPASGRVLVIPGADMFAIGAEHAFMGYAVSGATTAAADDAQAVRIGGVSGADNTEIAASKVSYRSGLAAGSTTFTAKYRSQGGVTCTYLRRYLIVIVY